MRKSPLDLIYSVVTDLSVSANVGYDSEKEVQLDLSDLNCTEEVAKISGEDSGWNISLQIRQETPPEKNSPYNFKIALVGIFQLHLKYPAGDAELFVTTHGTAMLYATAREQLRAVMANGPHLPLLLPTVNFLPDDQAAEPRSAEESDS